MFIANSNENALDLDGWKLRDRARNEFRLAGKVVGKGRLTVTMTEPTMPLSNDGGEVLLIDGEGVVRSQVAYGGFEVRAGGWVEFEQAEP